MGGVAVGGGAASVAIVCQVPGGEGMGRGPDGVKMLAVGAVMLPATGATWVTWGMVKVDGMQCVGKVGAVCVVQAGVCIIGPGCGVTVVEAHCGGGAVVYSSDGCEGWVGGACCVGGVKPAPKGGQVVGAFGVGEVVR